MARLRRFLCFVIALLSLLGACHRVRPPTPPESAAGELRGLPFQDPERLDEIQRTLRLIDSGGPFPHRQDGVIFGNRERRLPLQAHGYYHEYTVRTPGAKNRGARRIVRGDGGELYYSDDHYQSFHRFERQGRGGRP